MDKTNPISALKDIHLSSPITFWPPAVGWWFLGLFMVILIVFFSIKLFRFYHRKKQQFFALNQLFLLTKQYSDNNPANKKARPEALSKFLRQLAVHYYGRKEVAHLTGRAWLEFLDKTSKTTLFTQGVGQDYAQIPYNKDIEFNSSALIAVLRLWIKRGIP